MSVFLNTNVVVYAFSADDRKGEIARAQMALGGTLSVQVLNEAVSVFRRKLGFAWSQVDDALAAILSLTGNPIPVTLEMHLVARDLSRDHGVSIYDSLIVAAAQLAGCKAVLTEDLQHGRQFGNVRIINPFVESKTGAPDT